VNQNPWRTIAAAIVLTAMPVQAMAEAAPASVAWRKGATVLTPINDSYGDIVEAATQAEAVAARTATITDLAAALPAPVVLPSTIAPPLAGVAEFAAIGPVALPDEQNMLPYLGLAGLLLPPLLIGAGDGDSSGELGAFPDPEGGVTQVPPASALPQPLPAVPEPATWFMLLLGFAAIGAALRRAPGRRSAGIGRGCERAVLTIAG